MKNQVQLFKKSFNNICQKLRKNKKAKVIEEVKPFIENTKSSHDYYSIKCSQSVESSNSSSGYTSGCSEDIFDNEQRIELKTSSTSTVSNTTAKKFNLIKYLLDFEVIYMSSIQNGLECFIRPLMAVLDNKIHFQIFQNFEKINSLSKFIQNKILESFEINGDFVQSTIDVIYEYVCLTCSSI